MIQKIADTALYQHLIAFQKRKALVAYRCNRKLDKWRLKIKELINGKSAVPYEQWIETEDALDDAARDAIRKSIRIMPRQPFLSVLMPVYNPPVEFLEKAVQSVRNQLYPNWELCIADDRSTDPAIAEALRRLQEADRRIRVVFRKENGHISEATNSALDIAEGEYITLLDHDDELPEHALYRVAAEIVQHPDAMLIYSDEDKIDPDGKRCSPYFKSDWNPDLFLSQNMFCHLGVYRTSLAREVGGFRKGFEGAQDYDFTMRCADRVRPEQIRHITRILYHWRIHGGSTSFSMGAKPYVISAAERTIHEHLDRQGIEAQVSSTSISSYRVKYSMPTPQPAVSIIVDCDKRWVLPVNCTKSLIANTDYPNSEIILLSSRKSGILTKSIQNSAPGKIRIMKVDPGLNPAAVKNSAAANAAGDFLCFLDDCVEPLNRDWLTEMMIHACRRGVGAIGAALWYADNRLYHGGYFLGAGDGVARHSHSYSDRGSLGYYGKASIAQAVTAVSGSCILVRKKVYREIGGFDENNLTGYFDIDFCLRLREAGYRNIWTPYAEFVFHGSGRQMKRVGDVRYMRRRWGALLEHDPFYNPNLSLERIFQVARRPRIVNNRAQAASDFRYFSELR